MGITQKDTYVIGSNADLSNALLNIDLNRIGGDLTYLENDGGTLKVSIGSLIESEGSIYAVDTAAETPTGSAVDGAYLFFDASVPGFVWSSTAGTYDATRGGLYDGSDRRQCRFRLKSSTTWDVLLFPESPDVAIEGNLTVDSDIFGDTIGSHVGPTEGLHVGPTEGLHVGPTEGLHVGTTEGLHVYSFRYDSGNPASYPKTNAEIVTGMDTAYGATIPRDTIISCVGAVTANLTEPRYTNIFAFEITGGGVFTYYRSVLEIADVVSVDARILSSVAVIGIDVYF